MSEDDSNLIRITHYINPHMFWYKYETSFFTNTKLLQLDNELQQYFLKNQKRILDKFEPKLDQVNSCVINRLKEEIRMKLGLSLVLQDALEHVAEQTDCFHLATNIVAVFNYSWDRWIRAKVDHIAEFASSAPKYIVWAIDYGIPLVADIKHLKELPKHLAEIEMDNIYFGGIGNVVPAEKKFDFIRNCGTTVKCDQWSHSAVQTIEELINDAASVKFIRDKKTKDGQYFGDLEVTTHRNQIVKAHKVLLEIDDAVESTDFFKELRLLSTNEIPRWQTNDRNTQVFKYKMSQYKCNPKVVAPADTSVNYNKNDYDIEIEQKVIDWEKRNVETRYNNEVDNDDITPSESVSVAAAPVVTKRQENIEEEKEDDQLEAVTACGIRSRIRSKYKNVLLRKPAEAIEMENVLETPKPSKTNCVVETTNGMFGPSSGEDPLNKSNEENSETKSTTSGDSGTRTGATRARHLNLLKKHKQLQALSLNEAITQINEAPKKIYPAGVDLTYLQPKKEEKFNNKKVDKNVEYKNQALKTSPAKKEPLRKNTFDDIDEVCVPTNLKKHLVLVHGKHIARPIDKLANANFSEDIHQELDHMRLNKIYRIQSYCWPHLMRGNSLVVINGAKTGKTLSYLPAICSLVKMKIDENEVPDNVGPVGIIVAPSSVAAEHISRLCRRFFSRSTKKCSIVQAFGIRSTEKAEIHLLDGCGILVATPPSLARLLTRKLTLFDPKRLQHLVIDNIDIMHEELRGDLRLILRKCCSLGKNNNKSSVQLVVTTRSWHPILNAVLEICNNPQLCIGAYMEAAVYTRSKIRLKLVENHTKAQSILSFIKAHPYSRERLLIICNKDDDVREVADLLKSASCYFSACHSQSRAEDIDLCSEWAYRFEGDMTILVCTDSVLPELKIQNAQNVIHYSLPGSWSEFTFRFASHFGYYEDLIKNEEPEKAPATSLILLDETNNNQLPKLVDFLQKHNCTTIPKEIINLSNSIKIQREEQRITNERELCPYLLELGECFEEIDCIYRHILTKHDAPDSSIPTKGNIIVKILEVVSPAHYCVRLLEHRSSSDSPWKKINKSSDYLKFNLEFAKYFGNINNHQTHWPINMNDLCVAIYMNNYYRCKIIDVPKNSKRKVGQDFSVLVKLVDAGSRILCKSSNLLTLPPQFIDYPFQAINLRLLGIAPFDFEHDWDSKSISTVKYWIDKFVTNDIQVNASVNFSIKDTIWVDNIVLLEHLKSINSSVYNINIKSTLLEKKLAIPSNAGEIIKQLAMEVDILAPDGNTSESEIPTNKEQDGLNSSSLTSSSSPSHKKSTYMPLSTSFTTSSVSCKENQLNKTTSNSDRQSLVKDKSGSTENGVRTSRRSKDKKERSYNEKWEALPETDFTRIQVGTFYTPNHFYVQSLSNLERLEVLYSEIDEFVLCNEIPLSEAKIGQVCLAKYDGKYNRAKITKVVCGAEKDQIQFSVFFCDIGITNTFYMKDLLQTSEKIVQLLPYQAIRCKLTGIVSRVNGVWTEEICDKIYDEMIDACQYLYVRPVKTEEPNFDNDIRYWKHEVLLVDCTDEKDEKLNVKIVEKGLADYDPETKHYLDLIVTVKREVECTEVESAEEDDNWDKINYVRPTGFIGQQQLESNPNSDELIDLDIEFTQEEILQLLNLPPTARLIPADDNKVEPKPEKPEKQQPLQKSSIDTRLEDTASPSSSFSTTGRKIKKLLRKSKVYPFQDAFKTEPVVEPKVPKLKKLYKTPQVSWQQSDSLICLNINAPDISDYFLKVTSTHLSFITTIENETSLLNMNFLGAIDPALTSHEIRGLSVIVRLVKGLKGFSWPRLLWESDKHAWLKYNYDAIIVEDEQLENCAHILPKSYNNCDFSSSHSSSDEIDYDFRRPQNDDNVFDPLADDFE